MKNKFYLLIGLLLAALFVNVGGVAYGASAPSALSALLVEDEGEIEVVQTPEGTVPTGDPVPYPTNARCIAGDQRKVIDREVYDSEGPSGIVWHFRLIVYRTVCTNFTGVKEVMVSYWVNGVNANKHCNVGTDFGVDEVKLNAGDVAGWNVPAKTWPCSNSVTSRSWIFDAPNATQIFASNDNAIGMAAIKIRNNLPDDNYQVPLIRVTRP